MLSDHRQYLPRKPRHGANDGSGFPVRIERRAERWPSTVDAALVNCSRQGFQLRTSVSLVSGEHITLHLYVPESGFHVALAGTVRWQRPDAGANWLLGCLFEQEVAWETMGELFLQGVLSTGTDGE